MLCDLIRPRVCELGKIKIGGLGEERPKKSGGTYRLPEKHDYFTVTTLLRNQAGDLEPDAELMDSLKEFQSPDGKLRQLPISLLSNDPDDVMQAAYVWYNGRRIAARSDGRTVTRFFDLKTGWLPKPVISDWKPEDVNEKDTLGNKVFKLHVTFNCVVAAPTARWGGVYKFRSTSHITAENLYGSMTQLRALTGGQLRGLPLRLVVRPIQVSPEGKTTTVYVVHIELRGPDLQSLQQMALDRAKFEIENARTLGQLQQEYRAMLVAPGEGESVEDQAEVAAEFHPSSGEGILPERRDEQPPTADKEGDFAFGIVSALNEAELISIGQRIKAAHEAKELDDAARARLGVKYKTRLATLKTSTTDSATTTAAQSEPVSEVVTESKS